MIPPSLRDSRHNRTAQISPSRQMFGALHHHKERGKRNLNPDEDPEERLVARHDIGVAAYGRGNGKTAPDRRLGQKDEGCLEQERRHQVLAGQQNASR